MGTTIMYIAHVNWACRSFLYHMALPEVANAQGVGPNFQGQWDSRLFLFDSPEARQVWPVSTNTRHSSRGIYGMDFRSAKTVAASCVEKFLIIISRCPVPLPLTPGCLSIGAWFNTSVTYPETISIGAHRRSLDDCSLAREILPGFGCIVYTKTALWWCGSFNILKVV